MLWKTNVLLLALHGVQGIQGVHGQLQVSSDGHLPAGAVGQRGVSDIGPQGRMELCETLDQLLEFGPLLWV